MAAYAIFGAHRVRGAAVLARLPRRGASAVEEDSGRRGTCRVERRWKLVQSGVECKGPPSTDYHFAALFFLIGCLFRDSFLLCLVK